jgi:hypothetical protein
MSLFPQFLRNCLQAPSPESPGSGHGSGAGLDFEDPQDNLYAFGKLWATYAGSTAGVVSSLRRGP